MQMPTKRSNHLKAYIAYTLEYTVVLDPSFVCLIDSIPLRLILHDVIKSPGTIVQRGFIRSPAVDTGYVTQKKQLCLSLVCTAYSRQIVRHEFDVLSSREFRDAARVMGNTALFQQMEAASAAIKRDVIFAASLYVA